MLRPLVGWQRGSSSWIWAHSRVPGAQGQLVGVIELAACVLLDKSMSQEPRSVPRGKRTERMAERLTAL